MRVLRRGIESSCDDSIYILGVNDALLVRYTLEEGHSVLLESELAEEFLLLGVVLVAGLLSEELHEVRRVHEHLRVLYTQYLLEEGLCLLVAAYV